MGVSLGLSLVLIVVSPWLAIYAIDHRIRATLQERHPGSNWAVVRIRVDDEPGRFLDVYGKVWRWLSGRDPASWHHRRGRLYHQEIIVSDNRTVTWYHWSFRQYALNIRRTAEINGSWGQEVFWKEEECTHDDGIKWGPNAFKY